MSAVLELMDFERGVLLELPLPVAPLAAISCPECGFDLDWIETHSFAYWFCRACRARRSPLIPYSIEEAR